MYGEKQAYTEKCAMDGTPIRISDRGQVDAQLGRIEEQIERAEHQLNRVQERINPVLRPELCGDEAKGGLPNTNSPDMCTLACRLAFFADRLTEMGMRLSDLHGRVEL